MRVLRFLYGLVIPELVVLGALMILLAFLATGCATTQPPTQAQLTAQANLTAAQMSVRADLVKFDRGAFALSYARFVGPMLDKCARAITKAPEARITELCTRIVELDKQVEAAIVDAPKSAAAEANAAVAASMALTPVAPPPNPLDQLLPLIMRLAPLAAGL